MISERQDTVLGDVDRARSRSVEDTPGSETTPRAGSAPTAGWKSAVASGSPPEKVTRIRAWCCPLNTRTSPSVGAAQARIVSEGEDEHALLYRSSRLDFYRCL